jgi:hypothetical protein
VSTISQGHSFGEVRHPFPIGLSGSSNSIPGGLLRKTPISCRKHEAGAKPLDVPFPWTGKCLVEVVDIKNQSPFWGGEAPKVHEVAIATRLNYDPGNGRICEVP